MDRLDCLKELIRYGTTLRVELPEFVLNEENKRFEKTKKALYRLETDDDLEIIQLPIGGTIQVEVGLDDNVSLTDISRPISEDFVEYKKLITDLNKSNRRINTIADKYILESDKILAEARKLKDEQGQDIIKEKYGGNNVKTRKKYVEEELFGLTEERKELEVRVSEITRSIYYLRELIKTKRVLMEVEDSHCLCDTGE